MTSRTRRTRKTEKSDGVDFGIGEDGLDIGIDFKGFKASISTSGILKLGIGVAAVELNLKDPNESKVSYAFDIFEIEGKREGCTVELIYSIAGEEVKRETRKVPECDEEEPEAREFDEEEEEEFDPYDESLDPPHLPGELNTNLSCQALLNGREYDTENPAFLPKYVTHRLQSTVARVYFNKHLDKDGFSNLFRWVVITRTKFREYGVNATKTHGGTTWIDKSADPTAVLLARKSEFEHLHVLNGNWEIFGYPPQAQPSEGVVNLYRSSETSPGQRGSYGGLYFKDGSAKIGGNYSGLCRVIIGSGYSIRNRIVKAYKESGQKLQYSIAYLEKAKKHLEDAPPTFTDKRKKEPVMNKDCCAKIDRIYEALDVDELLDQEVKVPNRLIVSGGKGSKKYNTYLQLIDVLIREVDLTGIHPFKAKVTDANAAQAGDQSVEMEFANATAAAKQIAELLLENKGDSATRLNLMMRTAIATGQILNVVSIVAKNIENLINFVGMPVQEKVKLVKMPFDFTFGKRKETKGKGFGKQNTVSQSGIDALDINTEEATEALLPKFMQDEQQPIIYKQLKPKQPGLIDIIRGKK